MALRPDDHLVARYSVSGRPFELDGTAQQIILHAARHAEDEHPGQDVDFARVNRLNSP